MRLPRLHYSWRQLLGDFSGGLIAALIALPYGLAIATLMGLPPILGLFTSLLTSPVTAVLGRNPVLIGGTSSVTVPVIADLVRQQGAGGAAKVTLVAAVIMMCFSLLRLGRYVSFVPQAVVSGFSCGIGGMMVISQLRTIFGIRIPARGSMIEQLIDVVSSIGALRLEPLLLAALVIAVCAAIARFAPRWPAPLIGVALALAAARFAGVHEQEVGALSLALPPFASFAWSARDIAAVLPSAFILAFVSSVNLLVTSRVVEHFRGWKRSMKRADADAELGAYGIANVMAGVFGAPMSVGIPARSVANVRCGGTTRLSNLFHVAMLAAMIGTGAGILAHIPLAALAGVTAWMGFCLLDWSAWKRLPRMKPADAFAFLLTALLVVGANAVSAIAAGCCVYAIGSLSLQGRDRKGAVANARSSA